MRFARSLTSFAVALTLTGCVTTTSPAPSVQPEPTQSAPRVSATQASRNFNTAVTRIEPIAERICRDRNPRTNCDFLIQIHPDANAPKNALQTLDKNGRPLLVFTQALIRDARNADEIALVVGHEAAHHIGQHIGKQRNSAAAGAVLGSIIAAVGGADASNAEAIARVGATVGARSYSKEHELEADALGTQIMMAAGFDPVRGVQFFNRIPDPGDRFLGTHPPNPQRIATVKRVAAGG